MPGRSFCCEDAANRMQYIFSLQGFYALRGGRYWPWSPDLLPHMIRTRASRWRSAAMPSRIDFFEFHSSADPNGDIILSWGFCLGFYGDDLPGVDVSLCGQPSACLIDDDYPGEGTSTL